MLSEAPTHTAVPCSLADFTRPALVAPELRQRDTAGIISELSLMLQREGCFPDVLPFYQAALNQELMANSALDCGLAFPHARLGGVKRLQFAFGRTPQPVIWGAKSPWPVQFVFLLAVPATDAATYLHLLSSLARLGQRPDLLAELRAAQSTEAILAALGEIRMRQG
jgi:mannitol/fructose-specific phosphotransferase system IIA component (Ntr-type)